MPEQSNGTPSKDFFRPENQPLDLQDLVVRYLKYLPWLVLCVLISLGVAYLKIRYSIPIYHVQSTLLIKNDVSSQTSKDAKLGELFMAQPMINLNDEIQLLRSSPILARVVRDLGLQTSYYNRGSVRSSLLYNETPCRLLITHLSDSITAFQIPITIINENQFFIGKEKTLYVFGQPFKIENNECILFRNTNVSLKVFHKPEFTVTWAPAILVGAGLAGDIKIAQVSDYSNVLVLSMETENTNMGIDVLNTIMGVYDSLIVEDKNRIAINTMNFIDSRLASLKDSLGGVEGNLRTFMEKNQTFDINDQAKTFMTNISDAGKNLETQMIQLKIIDWLIDYMKRPEHLYSAVPTNLGIQEPTLTQEFTEYNKIQQEREANLKTTTADNPLIQSLNGSLERLRQNMLQALDNVRNAYLIAQNAMEAKNNELQGRLKEMPGKSMHELAIQRQQQILQELYYYLLQKKLETSISSASTISNSKVVEPASGDDDPVKPNGKSLYITYMLIGLALPGALIAIIEVLSDKVKNQAEIQKATQAPILGEIGHSEDEKSLVVVNNSRKFIAEQFRIIRTNLQYIVGRNERPVILVTSTFSGEGKSFVSTNMGAVMALTGKKTVVMEFDIRKPKIVSGLDLKRKMGITNYIIGSASFEDLPIKVEDIDNFYVIPCGPIPPNPSELLLSPRLQELIETARKNFEVVILDSAPVGLVSDAINLAQFADCTLYIVRRGHTPRKLLNLVNELYINKRLPSLSILLNDVKTEGGYLGRYYGNYGYYGYGKSSGGYFDEEKRSKRKKPTDSKRMFDR
jgi:tyrosine-protein kinase Etk/Wzc